MLTARMVGGWRVCVCVAYGTVLRFLYECTRALPYYNISLGHEGRIQMSPSLAYSRLHVVRTQGKGEGEGGREKGVSHSPNSGSPVT